MYRKTAYIMARIAGLFVVAIMACIFAIQTPRVQTRLTQKATEKLLEVFDGTLRYDDLQIMPSGALIIKNALLTDDSPYIEDEFDRQWDPVDTLFSARTITATFSIAGLFRSEGLQFGRVSIEDASMHLTLEPGEYETNLTRIFRIQNDSIPPVPGPELFNIRKVNIKNFRFRMNNFTEEEIPYSGTGINYDDLDLRIESLRGRGLRYSGAKVYGSCDELILTEKSGYILDHLSASCEIGLGKAEIRDIHLVDPWSDFKVRLYSMGFDDIYAFYDYVNEVKMTGEIRGGTLAMKTLSYFTGALADSKTVLKIDSGSIKGYTNDLSIRNFKFKDEYSQISAEIDCKLLGLPEIGSLSIDSDIRALTFTTRQLSKFLSELTGSRMDFSGYAPGQRMVLNARARGPLNRLRIDSRINSGIGSVVADADIRNLIDKARAVEASAAVKTEGLNLGAITGNETLGELSASTSISAVLTNNNPQIRLDSLHIDRFNAFGNSFRNISASGTFSDGTLDTEIESLDPKMKLSLASLVDLRSTNGRNRIKIDGKLDEIDLYALKIDERSTVSKVSLDIKSELVQTGSSIDGELLLSGIKVQNSATPKNLGDIILRAYTDEGEQNFKMESSFADIFLNGNGDLRSFINEVQEISTRRDLSALYTDSTQFSGNHRYSIDILLHDSRDLMSYAAPGVYIDQNTSLTLSIEKNGELFGNLYSPRLAYGNSYIREVDLQFDNLAGSLNAYATSSELKSGNFLVTAPDISAFADDNSISLSAKFDSFAGAGGSGRIYIDGQIYRDQDGILVIKANPHDSYLATLDGVWNFSDSDFVFHGNDFYINHFKLSNGDQLIDLNGGISKDRADTMAIKIEQFDLAIVDEFLLKKLAIEGRADGQVFLTSNNGQAMGMLMDVKMDSLSIDNVNAGKLQIASILEDEGEDINIFIRNEIEGRDALYASGTYYLDDGRTDISAEIKQLPIGLAGPFIKNVFSESGGSLSGQIHFQGMEGNYSASSKDLRIEDAKLRIAYTGVDYTLNGPVHLDESGLHLDGLDIRDNSGGSATLNGDLLYSSQKPTLDGSLSLLNIKLLDAVDNTGAGIYGMLRASGSAEIHGPLNALAANADLSTTGDGNIHIAANSASTSTTSNLLTFTESEDSRDPYEEMVSGYNRQRMGNNDVDINARVRIRPGVTAYVEIDKSAGNIASFSGSGTIDLHIRPSRALFTVNGDYNVSEGNYQFVLPGIMTKDFKVQNGSSIKFAGDLMDTELDINVLHSLQTSLTTIIPSNSTGVGTRRLVECGIAITDRLRDPRMEFSINIPDLDPTTKSQVETALNTEDKIQKQFIALLLMGSFIPDEGSGVFNGSDVLLSNVSELMSNQINSIFQKLEIPLDMGIGYQGLTDGTNMFDVAISTQLFNNRVIVGGSVKNRRLNNSVSTAEVVGDLDIQVKLDKQGQFRLNLFSHSADEYSSFLDLSQRNGVGVSYQQEYNKFGEFLRNIFKSRKQKALEAAQPPAETEMVIIKIDEDERKAISDTSSVGR